MQNVEFCLFKTFTGQRYFADVRFEQVKALFGRYSMSPRVK